MSEIKLDTRPHLFFLMKHHLGSINLDVAFELTKPWSVIFAPSGAGKTTILRAIAGLIRPHAARIVLSIRSIESSPNKQVVTDTSSLTFRPCHLRGVRMVSQNAALFPHLSVLENVTYSDKSSSQPSELLALCRIEGLTGKMPNQLSGGERQRVALARSLAAPGCNLLLLDEPFTGMEAPLRDDIIVDLRAWLARRSIPTLSVTHDISEAFVLDAEVLRLSGGRITAQGPVAEVLAEERARLIAQLS